MIKGNVWGIHTQDDSLFLEHSIIAIGWHDMGDLSKIEANKTSFEKKYVQVYPASKKGQVSISVGMLYRFVHEMKVGDYVVFPSKSDRNINIGVIESEYYYDSTAPAPYFNVQQRRVKWLKHVPRKYFSENALYEVGSAMTLFRVKTNANEFLKDKPNSGGAGGGQLPPSWESMQEATKDFLLTELSKNLNGYAFQAFVADLLRAMGYRTFLTAQGGDHGIDIIAYKDELPPRIIVQVKRQEADVTESTLQALKGTLREGDYGLFVTTSGYTKNAKQYLANMPIIRGISGVELADLVLKYYNDLDESYKTIIPLRMVYMPDLKMEQ